MIESGLTRMTKTVMPSNGVDRDKRLRIRKRDKVQLATTISSEKNFLGLKILHRKTLNIKFNRIRVITSKIVNIN